MRRASEQLGRAVGEAVTVTEQNRQAAEAMGQLNNRMVESLDAMSAVVEENTASTEEMAAGSEEVARAIEGIASVSEQNGAAVEEVSAAAGEMTAQVIEVTASAQGLAAMAETLQEIVGRFRLAAEAAPSDSPPNDRPPAEPKAQTAVDGRPAWVARGARRLNPVR